MRIRLRNTIICLLVGLAAFGQDSNSSIHTMSRFEGIVTTQDTLFDLKEIQTYSPEGLLVSKTYYPHAYSKKDKPLDVFNWRCTYRYDANQNLVEKKLFENSDSLPTQAEFYKYKYNEQGLLVEETCQIQYKEPSFFWNKLDATVKIFEYDGKSQLIWKTQYYQMPSGLERPGGVVHYQYDRLGRLIIEKSSFGTKKFLYRKRGNSVRKVYMGYSRGEHFIVISKHWYNSQNQLVKQWENGGSGNGETVKYHYNESGQLSSKYKKGKVSRLNECYHYRYDDLGRLIEETIALEPGRPYRIIRYVYTTN